MTDRQAQAGTPALRDSLSSLGQRLYRLPGETIAVTRTLPVHNASLELDKFLRIAEPTGDAKPVREALYDRIAGAGVPPTYAVAYDRWKHYLQRTWGDRLIMTEIPAISPVVAGLGGETVLEASIRLQRLSGMPLIPGSALKGMTAAYVRHGLAVRHPGDFAARLPDANGVLPEPNAQTVLFGDQDCAAWVTWCDAWYVPPDDADHPLHRDVTTVHHPQYYGQQGAVSANPPWDFDDPNPNPFLSTRGSFLFAVIGPDRTWAELAWDLLRQALHEQGVGAKTSSGYGRFAAP